MTDYTYNVTDTANNAVDSWSLREQVNADTAITIHCAAVSVAGDTITLTMAAGVSSEEKTQLDSVVGVHDGKSQSVDPPIAVEPHEANYGGSSAWEGDQFQAAAGTDTPHDFKVTTAGKLFEGTFWCAGVKVGDWVEFCVVDVDGVYAPAGTVLKKYVTKMRVADFERRTMRSGQSADIPANVYLRTTYHSTGTDPVDVLLDYLFVR